MLKNTKKLKEFELKGNEEIVNCLNRIVKLCETLIQQNMHIELHNILSKGSK